MNIAATGDIDITVAIVGAFGIILGAALTSWLQVVVLSRQRDHALEDRRLERKRQLYETYLKWVIGLPGEIDKAIRNDDYMGLMERNRQLGTSTAAGVRLDARPDVRAEIGDVQAALSEYFRRGAAEPGSDASPEKVKGDLYDEIVRPPLERMADVMAEDLRSRG